MPDHVFISYAHQDADFAERLAEYLRGVGIATWMDRQQLKAGDDWTLELEKAIKDAAAVVMVVSAVSLKSEWVMHEAHAALARLGQGALIPVVVDGLAKTRLPAWLNSIQWLDFQHEWDGPFAALVSALTKFRRPQPVEPVVSDNLGYAFISYSSADLPFVRRLRAFLSSSNYGFVDFHTAPRRVGSKRFVEELEGYISQASVVLVVLSGNWKRSIWAYREFMFSEEIGRPTLLLKAGDMPPALLVAGQQYIDFVSDDGDAFTQLGELLRTVGGAATDASPSEGE